MGARDQIRQRFNELSPALQQVARYVLDHPNEVVTGSMRNVGTRSQSTPATLVRFAQHLGFEGWPQLKEGLCRGHGPGSETYGGRAKQLVGRAKDQTLTGEMFEVQRRNLEATHRQSEQALQKACALIEKAPAVHAAGFAPAFPSLFRSSTCIGSSAPACTWSTARAARWRCSSAPSPRATRWWWRALRPTRARRCR
jgi:DNA-binding MurR/RpiR family transcriptional regulator